MNDRDIETFFNRIQKLLPHNDYIKLIEIYEELITEKNRLKEENVELRKKLNSK